MTDPLKYDPNLVIGFDGASNSVILTMHLPGVGNNILSMTPSTAQRLGARLYQLGKIAEEDLPAPPPPGKKG